MLKNTSKARSWIITLLASITLGLASTANAEEMQTTASSPLFQSNSILEVTLKADLPNLIHDRSKSYHSASMEVVDPAVRDSGFKMKVSTRGMTSLGKCRFPHLRFKFNTDLTQNTLLRNLSKVKIVSHCDNPDWGDTYANEQKEVILQYTLYRMYNLLTDYSIKVRLARMHYVDTSGSMKSFTKYAFFIEPEDSVAERFGAKAEERRSLNNKGYSSRNLNWTYAGMNEFFQFMVGNGDWRMLYGDTVNILNTNVISGSDIGLLPMPYDLDRAGMCNGSFAYHSIFSNGNTFPIVGDDPSTIRNIYVQNYQGHKTYKYAVSRIREKRDEIYALYDSMKPLIGSHYRNRSVGHLDRFYEAIGTRVDADFEDLIAVDERP